MIRVSLLTMVVGDAYAPTLIWRKPITPSKGARNSVNSIWAFTMSISAFKVSSSVRTCSYASWLTASCCNRVRWRYTLSLASLSWACKRFNSACNCLSFTLASSWPLVTWLPSLNPISTTCPDVSKERSTSSSGNRLPLTVNSSVRTPVRTFSAFTFKIFFFALSPLSTLSAWANSEFNLGNWE